MSGRKKILCAVAVLSFLAVAIAAIKGAVLESTEKPPSACPIYRSLYLSNVIGGSAFIPPFGQLENRALTIVKPVTLVGSGVMIYGATPPSVFNKIFNDYGFEQGNYEDSEFDFDTTSFYPANFAKDAIDISHCFSEMDEGPLLQEISDEEIRASYASDDKLLNVWGVTTPAFSKNGNYALIYVSNHCGYECGWGEFILLTKKNDEWVVLGYHKIWIS